MGVVFLHAIRDSASPKAQIVLGTNLTNRAGTGAKVRRANS